MKDVCFEPKFDFTFPVALTKLCCINIALTKSDNCMNECQSGKKDLISFTISVQYRIFAKTRGLFQAGWLDVRRIVFEQGGVSDKSQSDLTFYTSRKPYVHIDVSFDFKNQIWRDRTGQRLGVNTFLTFSSYYILHPTSITSFTDYHSRHGTKH